MKRTFLALLLLLPVLAMAKGPVSAKYLKGGVPEENGVIVFRKSFSIPNMQEEQIRKAKDDLIGAGALGSLMTGSGSAVFGVFDHPQKAKAALEIIKKDYTQAWVCDPVTSGVQIIRLG